MSFVRTTSINKILALTKRKKVIQGGTSASKTYSILAILIDKAIKTPGLEISVVSETIPHLRRGANKDFIKIMKETGRWRDDNYNKSLLVYTFGNGSYIEFFSAESIIGARRNILYINEANNVSFEDYYQMASRTSGDIYLDFNPVTEFWVHTEVLKDPNSELLVLTYEDNEASPPNIIEDFAIARRKASEEKEKGLPISSFWQNYCLVYIEGKKGNIRGVVFDNWELTDKIPEGARFISDGMDFGFTNDPTVLIGVWMYGGELYVKQFIYERGLTNQDISNKIKAIPRNEPIIADSAEPKSIEELRRLGHRVTGANKGKDSIKHSINTLQQYRINITKDSVDVIEEFRRYRWVVDNSNEPTNDPVDYNNHAIDALRYVALNKINRTSGKFSTTFGSM